MELANDVLTVLHWLMQVCCSQIYYLAELRSQKLQTSPRSLTEQMSSFQHNHMLQPGMSVSSVATTSAPGQDGHKYTTVSMYIAASATMVPHTTA